MSDELRGAIEAAIENCELPGVLNTERARICMKDAVRVAMVNFAARQAAESTGPVLEKLVQEDVDLLRSMVGANPLIKRHVKNDYNTRRAILNVCKAALAERSVAESPAPDDVRELAKKCIRIADEFLPEEAEYHIATLFAERSVAKVEADEIAADELIEKCADIAEQEFVSYHAAAKVIRALKGKYSVK